MQRNAKRWKKWEEVRTMCLTFEINLYAWWMWYWILAWVIHSRTMKKCGWKQCTENDNNNNRIDRLRVCFGMHDLGRFHRLFHSSKISLDNMVLHWPFVLHAIHCIHTSILWIYKCGISWKSTVRVTLIWCICTIPISNTHKRMLTGIQIYGKYGNNTQATLPITLN